MSAPSSSNFRPCLEKPERSQSSQSKPVALTSLLAPTEKEIVCNAWVGSMSNEGPIPGEFGPRIDTSE